MKKALFIFLFFVPFLVKAQITEFSENREELLKELGVHLKIEDIKSNKAIFKVFEEQYLGGLISVEEGILVRGFLNTMLEKKMAAKPYFTDYLNSLNGIYTTQVGKAPSIMKDWHQILDALVAQVKGRTFKEVGAYLQFSNGFFLGNSLKPSQNGVNWVAMSDNFSLGMEEAKPTVSYDKLELWGIRKSDTIQIVKTRGIFYPLENIWFGEEGRVNWRDTAIQDEIYVELYKYSINTIKSEYQAEKAKLFYLSLGLNGVLGTFTDKATASSGSSGISYPRFISDQNVLKIENIGPGIKYFGGFKIEGASIIGFGTKETPAKITIHRNNELKMKALSQSFIIRKGEKISGKDVTTVLYFDQDSIYHPAVTMKYDIPNKDLGLTRGETGISKNPFFDSYHNIQILSDKINWIMDTDSILIGQKRLGIGNPSKLVNFESLNYYDDNLYKSIQNISDINPVSTLKILCEETGMRSFTSLEVAKRMNPRYGVSTVKPLLISLASQGFIFYDTEGETVLIKDKVFHYAEASLQNRDYDLINIESKNKETNAVLSLKTGDIDIQGVNKLRLNQNVFLKPLGSSLTLKKNRDMSMDGEVVAGLGIFLGKSFALNYDDWEIKMDSIEKFTLYVKSEEGTRPFPLLSTIDNVTGTLLIDAPNNKSGNEDIDIFPSFQSMEVSKIHYGSGDIQGGVYEQDSFYFELEPFAFNGLDDFTSDKLAFAGKLVSADIFPEFQELVSIQGDTSLGFVRQTPPEGYPIYGGKGQFTNEIALNNGGLIGNGRINFLNAAFDSENITFKPKQLLSKAELFVLEEKKNTAIEFPSLVGQNVSIDWKPYKDSMTIVSEEFPFKMLDGDYFMQKQVILTPGGLYGNGQFDWIEGTLFSRFMLFDAEGVSADTSNMNIKTIGSEELAFKTKNIKSDLDFEKKQGKFKANSSDVSTEMPYILYNTSMNEFDWDMTARKITFSTDANKTASFLSVHPKQDSLEFTGMKAEYDLSGKKLIVEGVPFIQAGDGFIYPGDGRVEIEGDAQMKRLDDARIVANVDNKFHIINRAKVQIQGKKSFTGSGFYEYNVGANEQEIKFDNIVSRERGKATAKVLETHANGSLQEIDEFLVDEKIIFKGDVNLFSSTKNLQFHGYMKMKSPWLANPFWFSVNTPIDRTNVQVNFDEPKMENGQKLFVGLRLSKETVNVYPLMLKPLQFRKDRIIFNTVGIMTHDKENDIFLFGDSLKLNGLSDKGNVVRFNNADGSFEAEGSFEIGDQLKYITLKNAGLAQTIYSDSAVVKLDLISIVNFIIPDKLIQIIEQDVVGNIFDQKDISFDRGEHVLNALAELIENPKELATAKGDLLSTGELKLSGKKQNTFVFGHLNMEWDPFFQSFTNSGKIGVSSIQNSTVNKYLEGFVEFTMQGEDKDDVTIYLRSPSGEAYYFNYTNGELKVYSTNPSFNSAVEGLKKKDYETKMDDKEFHYVTLSSQRFVNMFVSRMSVPREEREAEMDRINREIQRIKDLEIEEEKEDLLEDEEDMLEEEENDSEDLIEQEEDTDPQNPPTTQPGQTAPPQNHNGNFFEKPGQPSKPDEQAEPNKGNFFEKPGGGDEKKEPTPEVEDDILEDEDEFMEQQDLLDEDEDKK